MATASPRTSRGVWDGTVAPGPVPEFRIPVPPTAHPEAPRRRCTAGGSETGDGAAEGWGGGVCVHFPGKPDARELLSLVSLEGTGAPGPTVLLPEGGLQKSCSSIQKPISGERKETGLARLDVRTQAAGFYQRPSHVAQAPRRRSRVPRLSSPTVQPCFPLHL